jgi:predicted RNase H-like nuclease (RuvC/YqgF family)
METGNYEIICKNFNKLLKENEELQNKVRELSIINGILVKIIEHKDKIIENKDKTIEELQKENEELKARVSFLEKELKNTKDELAIVKKDLNTLKTNKLFQKIIIGLQDLNSWELLEKKISQPKILMRLRQNRIGDCHYIDNYFDLNEKEIRRNILIDKINENIEVQNKINTLYPKLLEILQPFLEKREVILDDDIVLLANNWWEL